MSGTAALYGESIPVGSLLFVNAGGKTLSIWDDKKDAAKAGLKASASHGESVSIYDIHEIDRWNECMYALNPEE